MGSDQVTVCRNIVNGNLYFHTNYKIYNFLSKIKNIGRVDFPNEIEVYPVAQDLIKKLLTKDPTKRLGISFLYLSCLLIIICYVLGCLKKGAEDIKSHPWFVGNKFQ